MDGTIAEIRSAVLEGNSYYYIRLIGSEVFFSISAAVSQEAVILSEGDQVTITYRLEAGAVLPERGIVPCLGLALR